MRANPIFQILVLISIFMIAFVLEIMPWPIGFQGLRPNWLVLVLIYWALALPNKVSVGTAFVAGIVWDLVLGSILGIHALVLSIAIYFVAKYHLILRNLSLWLQAILVMLYVVAIRFLIYFVELVLHSAEFNSQEVLGAIISGILWPWIFLLMRHIRRQLGLR
ncbi:rod shape-determining protein MreD [Actinobacillus equuli]|uniref:rod shape-determining protein MreD n=1 Tax=Actinobacillus equuli TaxID=718 RepID=UPI002442B094|nr:rod shape-determining protein MreD [Actinobacillus equuli]WGE42747.1 rod shape-determining protein MreD [Actinobacillus equuli subsp. haemolyticus]WGE47094.1 rod shape-determining protein MreD [Actinobacillus equuli subsp. haemolyticus]WGE53456.1 rod shape-determining protein MreD [Actinobacillus equuli subsp. haemolyticus]WGE59657.1 rod shape-determining protein MreD [Actinobacillus equuli subsp. haemolyticus]WGE61700.1 rod shape-determining protein MreD [Actinobacillus equuli subsp. haemo